MYKKTKEKITKLFIEQCAATPLVPTDTGGATYNISEQYIEFLNAIAAALEPEKALMKHLRKMDVWHVLMNFFLKLVPEEGGEAVWGKTLSEVSGDKIDSVATELIQFLESIPRNYKALFYLPIAVPAEFKMIELAPGVSLVRRINEKGTSLLAGMFGSHNKPEGIYLEVSATGYADNSLETDAMSSAYTIFKLFVLYGVLHEIFQKSFKTFKQSLLNFGVIKNEQSYVIDTDKETAFSLPNNAQNYVSQLALKEETLNKTKFEPAGLLGKQVPMTFDEALQDAFKPFAKFITKHLNAPEDTGYITTASDWAFEARTHENESHRLILGCIALEALIGEDARQNKTEILANRCASLLGKTQKDRAGLRKMFREAYDARSDLVHGATSRLNDAQRKHLSFFESVFDSIFRKEVRAFN